MERNSFFTSCLRVYKNFGKSMLEICSTLFGVGGSLFLANAARSNSAVTLVSSNSKSIDDTSLNPRVKCVPSKRRSRIDFVSLTNTASSRAPPADTGLSPMSKYRNVGCPRSASEINAQPAFRNPHPRKERCVKVLSSASAGSTA